MMEDSDNKHVNCGELHIALPPKNNCLSSKEAKELNHSVEEDTNRNLTILHASKLVNESECKLTVSSLSGLSLTQQQVNGPGRLVNGVSGDHPEPCTPCTPTDNSLQSSSQPNPVAEAKEDEELVYVSYESERQMPDIMRLIQKDLSEPYSIYTYRYFIHNWPQLCFLAMHHDTCVGAIVCKLDIHRKVNRRGYIAMLAVDEKYRKKKIGTNLVLKAIRAMVSDDADEIVLETEVTNKPALRLYENLGFVRDKRLFRYYLNGVDALRLKLWLR